MFPHVGIIRHSLAPFHGEEKEGSCIQSVSMTLTGRVSVEEL